MKKPHYLPSLLAVVLIPSTALANVGTPLMWASTLHLVFGNAILGLIEGLLLSWIFKSPKRISILVLIAANYASAWAVDYLLSSGLISIPDITIENIRLWFLIFVVVAFIVTLLIEFPFFWFALRNKRHSFVQTLKATPLIHSISYLLLVGWYWMASGTSMMTHWQVVSPDALTPRDHYALYYLSPDGTQVLQVALNHPEAPVVVSEVSAQHVNDRLFARARSDEDFDLFVRLDSDQRNNRMEKLISESFATKAPIEWLIAEGRSAEVPGALFHMGPVPTLAEQTEWEFRTGFWPFEGIEGENAKRNQRIRFSLETPIAAWRVRNATHLQGDYVVFQLGNNQICMLHPESKKVALLARGKGPIVVIPKTPN